MHIIVCFHVVYFLRSNPVDIYDKMGTDDVVEISSNEEVSLKQEQSGYMSMLEMIDDLKHSTERYVMILSLTL